MEIHVEQVERLKEKANVSYAQAKAALMFSNGNLLDALIYLEEQGNIPREEATSYSTRAEVPTVVAQSEEQHHQEQTTKPSAWDNFVRWFIDNELELWHRDHMKFSVPVLIPVVLFLCAFWIVIPALIIGLFCGFRYRFSGPDLEQEPLNRMMDSVADTASNIGQQVVDELNTQHQKYRDNKKK